MKTIKRRLTSVTTTKKIMKAMNMVAASKLQKDRARLEAARPFFAETQAVMDHLRSHRDAAPNAYFKSREINSRVYLIISSDRGLCGSYNANLAQAALAHMNESEASMKIIAVGLKGYDFFRRQDREIIEHCAIDNASYADAQRIAEQLAAMYNSGGAGEVYIAYTKYKSALLHLPQVERILPFEKAKSEGPPMNFDCDIAAYIQQAVPVYLSAFVYTAMLESQACEQAARMISMDTAVDNASDIAHDLTRAYNRRRQAGITQEISEIVASTSVMK